MGRRTAAAGLWVVCLVLAGCAGEGTAIPSGDPSSGQSEAPTPSGTAPSQAAPTDAASRVPTQSAEIASGLSAPWSVAVLDEDRALVSLRDTGEVLLLERGGDQWRASSAGLVTGVFHDSEGGLMGLAISPAGTEVYAMFTAARDNRVVRMPWDGARLGPAQQVLAGIPKSQIHNGGRIAFGPDQMLYIATGDAGEPQRAQDPADLAGKILRVAADGSVPTDNPIAGSAVYSLGHRNVQGLAFDETGQLWASEFGAKDVDEVNRITAGANYGWPLVEGPGGGQQFTDPYAWFAPTSTASPSGIAYAQGSLWVATLRGQTLFEVPVGSSATGQPVPHLMGEYGRLRDVVIGPAGVLWLVTNNTDGRGQPRPGDDRIIELRLEQAR